MAALDAAIHASRSLTQCTTFDIIAYFLDAATTYVSNAWMAGTRPAMTPGGWDFSKTTAIACLMTSGAEAARKGAAGEGGGPLDSGEGRIVLTLTVRRVDL